MDSPELFQEHNNQGEMNMHNFILARRYMPVIGPMILFFALVVPALPRLSSKLAASDDVPAVSPVNRR